MLVTDLDRRAIRQWMAWCDRRAPYRTPALVDSGDVRSLTMGASPGAGDSGQTLIFKP